MRKKWLLFWKQEELLKEVPDILGCDMNYDTSGVELKAYLSVRQVISE